MKPLTNNNLTAFMQRFENFKDADFRSLDVLSATQIQLVFAVQDKARAYDWISIEILFDGVVDAKLIEENQVDFVDMSDGLTLLYETTYTFAIGNYKSSQVCKDSILYVVSKTIKYKEGQF